MTAVESLSSFVEAIVDSILVLERNRVMETNLSQDETPSPSQSQIQLIAQRTPAQLLNTIIAWRNKEIVKPELGIQWTHQTMGVKLASECSFLSTCHILIGECADSSLPDSLWLGLEDYVFDWLGFLDKCAPLHENPKLAVFLSRFSEDLAKFAKPLTEKRRTSMLKRLSFEIDIRVSETPEVNNEILSRARKLPVLDFYVEDLSGVRMEVDRRDIIAAKSEIMNIIRGMRLTSIAINTAGIEAVQGKNPKAAEQENFVRTAENVLSLEAAVLALPRTDGANPAVMADDSASTSDRIGGSDSAEKQSAAAAYGMSILGIQNALISKEPSKQLPVLPVSRRARSVGPNLNEVASGDSCMSKEEEGKTPAAGEDSSGSSCPPAVFETSATANSRAFRSRRRWASNEGLVRFTASPSSADPPVRRPFKKWHDGTGDFQCNACGMKFPTSQAVRGHKNAHRHEKLSTEDMKLLTHPKKRNSSEEPTRAAKAAFLPPKTPLLDLLSKGTGGSSMCISPPPPLSGSNVQFLPSLSNGPPSMAKELASMHRRNLSLGSINGGLPSGGNQGTLWKLLQPAPVYIPQQQQELAPAQTDSFLLHNFGDALKCYNGAGRGSESQKPLHYPGHARNSSLASYESAFNLIPVSREEEETSLDLDLRLS